MGNGHVRGSELTRSVLHRRRAEAATSKSETNSTATGKSAVRLATELQCSAPATTSRATHLSSPYKASTRATSPQPNPGNTLVRGHRSTGLLPPLSATVQQESDHYNCGIRSNASPRGPMSNRGIGHIPYQSPLRQRRPPFPQSPTFPDASRVMDSSISPAVQLNKRFDLKLDAAAVATSQVEITRTPVGELECIASGFVSISDYIFVAESLKTLSVRILQMSTTRTAATRNSEDIPLHGSADDNQWHSVSSSGASWAAMRDKLVGTQNRNPLDSTSTSERAMVATAAATGRSDCEDAARVADLSVLSDPHRVEKKTALVHTEYHSAQGNKVDPNAEDNLKHDVGMQMTVEPPAEASSMTTTMAGHGETFCSTNDETTGRNSEVEKYEPAKCAGDLTDSCRCVANVPATVAAEAAASPPRLGLADPSSPGSTKTTLAVPPRPRPLSMSDLAAISEHDEVLNAYMQSLAKRVQGISSKLRAMKPASVLHFFLAAALSKTDWSCMAVLLPVTAAVPVRPFGFLDDKVVRVLPGGHGWISKKDVVVPARSKEEALEWQAREDALTTMGDELIKLFLDTKDITLSCMQGFAESMPLSICSRLDHKYLSPSSAILESYVGCGLHTRRRKDFFVSFEERAALLKRHNSFRDPEELLLGICQLSTLASQMMSSFALGAVLGCVSRWRELLDSGQTASDEAVAMMEQFATSYCAGYNILLNEAFPAMRKQYPNVFFLDVLSTEEEGKMPPILTVEMSMLMKLIFLLAGGLGSIRADDRRLIADAMQEEQQRHPLGASNSGSLAPSATLAAKRHATTLLGATASATAGHEQTQGSSREVLSLPIPLPVSGSDFSSPRTPSFSRVNGRTQAPRHSFNSALPTVSSEGSAHTGGTPCTNFRLVCSKDASGEISTVSDDVALAVALQMQSATLIVNMGGLLTSGPLVAHTSPEVLVRAAQAVSRVWRILFQTAGLLPFGHACPLDMAEWLPLFPLYTLSTHAKHAMLSVYARSMGQTSLTFGPVLREDILRSAVDALHDVVCAKNRKVSASSPSAAAMSQQSAPSLSGSSVSEDAVGARTAPVAKPVAPGNNPISYNLCPCFAPAASLPWHDPSASSSFHTNLSAPFMPSMITEGRQTLYELCARQSTETFLPGVLITKHVEAIPLPGGVAMLQVEKLADRSPTALQRLKAYDGRLALILSWRPALQGRVHNSTPAQEGPMREASEATKQTTDAPNAHTTIDAPVREGDEITIHWGHEPTGRAATTATELLATFYDPTRLMRQRSRMTVHGTKPIEVPEEASPSCKTKGHRRAHFNPKSSSAHGGSCSSPSFTTQEAEKVDTASSPPTSQSLQSTAVADPAVECTTGAKAPMVQRCRVSLILNTIRPNQFIVLLDTPNWISVSDTVAAAASATKTTQLGVVQQPHLSATPTLPAYRPGDAPRKQSSSIAMDTVLSRTRSIRCLFYHRRHCAPFTHEPNFDCAWVNPEILRGIDAHEPSALADTSSEKALTAPMLLGWLLGHSPGNDLVFTLPLPALAFRIMSLAMQLELPMEAIQLSAADLSLLYPDLANAKMREQLLQRLERLCRGPETYAGEEEVIALSGNETGCKPANGRDVLDDRGLPGSPVVARRHLQLLRTLLVDVSSSILSKTSSNAIAGHVFWNAVLCGMLQTPLMRTPLFSQCSARIVRDVLCGPYDHLQADFTFRESFVLIVEDGIKGGDSTAESPQDTRMLRDDRQFTRKAVMRVLDELPLKQRRLLLRFITGNSLRTRRSQMNTLRLVLQSGFPSTQPQRQTPMAVGGAASAETARFRGAHGDDAHAPAAPCITPPLTEAMARSCVDATLQLLPMAHPYECMLIIPNYFEALLMGTYRRRVLGADMPTLSQCVTEKDEGITAVLKNSTMSSVQPPAEECSPTSRVKKREAVVRLFDDADVHAAWRQLTDTQKATLCRRYRALLRHRLCAALYIHLVSNPDTLEDAWELGVELGFISSVEDTGKATTTAGEPVSAVRKRCSDAHVIDGVRRCTHKFVRSADGTVLYHDGDIESGEAEGTGCVGYFYSEENVDESNLEQHLLLANLGEEMAVCATTERAVCEKHDPEYKDALISGREGRVGQPERQPTQSPQHPNSPSASDIDALSNSKSDNLHGYCIAATFRFSEAAPQDTCTTGSTMTPAEDTSRHSPSAATTRNEHGDGNAGEAREIPDARRRTFFPAPPARRAVVETPEVEAPASVPLVPSTFTKRPVSNSKRWLPMAVATPRDPSMKAVGMCTILQRARMAAAAKTLPTPAHALQGYEKQSCAHLHEPPLTRMGTKRSVEQPTHNTVPTPAIHVTTTTPISAAAAVAAHSAPLQRESKAAQLRAEVDCYIQELFSDDKAPSL